MSTKGSPGPRRVVVVPCDTERRPFYGDGAYQCKRCKLLIPDDSAWAFPAECPGARTFCGEVRVQTDSGEDHDEEENRMVVISLSFPRATLPEFLVNSKLQQQKLDHMVEVLRRWVIKESGPKGTTAVGASVFMPHSEAEAMTRKADQKEDA